MSSKLKFGIKMAKLGFGRSDYHKKRVGAAYIEGPKIIIGSNSLKSSPISKRLNSHWERLHAEMAVLRYVEEGSRGTLFIYRHKADGSLGNSRPCPSCMELIKIKGIRKICYTTPEGIAFERLV